jgi:hypothetical protein
MVVRADKTCDGQGHFRGLTAGLPVPIIRSMSKRLRQHKASKPNAQVLILTLLLLTCPPGMATLIIGLYNNDAMFLASDSRATYVEANGTQKTFTVRKLFAMSDTYCVSIVNNYGGYVQETRTGRISLLLFPAELAIMCSNAYSVKQPIQSKITSIVSDFHLKYCEYMQKKLAPRTSGEDMATRLCFWGYDDSRKGFVCSSYLFDRTNQVPQESTFFVRGTNHMGSAVSLQGESTFLPAVLYGENKALAQLRTDEFTSTIGPIMAEVPIAENRITKFILQMFDLQKTHAAAYSSDKGWVDEPYIIYKLTKEKILQVR